MGQVRVKNVRKTDAASPRQGRTKGGAGSLEQLVVRLAHSTADLLLIGELGTGKRFLARLIHNRTPKGKRRQFIEITPLMTGDELRVVLFDEERKRVEGMLGRPVARLEKDATLFVNHLDEFSILDQTRFARFLMVRQSGNRQLYGVSRVIISSLVPARKLLAPHALVTSLSQALAGFEHVDIPLLRQRPDDIPLIVGEFLETASAMLGRKMSISTENMKVLMEREWHENIRELKRLLQEALAHADGGAVTPPTPFGEVETVKAVVRSMQAGKISSLVDVLEELEKRFVQRALVRAGYDVRRAARLLGLPEQNLRYRIRKHNITLRHKGYEED